MSGERIPNGNNGVGEAPTDGTKSQGFFRGLLRGTRFGRNGDSRLRETFEELIEQHEENEPPVDPVVLAQRQDLLLEGLRLVPRLVELVWVVELLPQQRAVDLVLNADSFECLLPFVDDFVLRAKVLIQLYQVFSVVFLDLLVHRVQIAAVAVIQLFRLAVQSVRNGFQLLVDQAGLILVNGVYVQTVGWVRRPCSIADPFSFVDEFQDGFLALLVGHLLDQHPVHFLSINPATVL